MMIRIGGLLLAVVSALLLDHHRVSGFSIHSRHQHQRIPMVSTAPLSAAANNKEQQQPTTTTVVTKKQTRTTVVAVSDEDDEKPAGVVGAQFFGGNKQKEEFFDADAEIQASLQAINTDANSRTYNRFTDRAAFPDATVAALAESVQVQINRVLFADGDDDDDESAAGSAFPYSNDNMQWETGLRVQRKHPMKELEAAMDFYRRVDVAIIAGEQQQLVRDNVFTLRWEMSLLWPAIWEPRVLLTGTSTLTVDPNSKEITKQVDTLDSDLLSSIQKQILPRFWDLYHIGMTPAAEVSPKLNVKTGGGPLFRYTVSELPPRLVLQPTIMDYSGNRDDSNAAVLPNHAFTCVIKTMGPTKQIYTPVTGVQVQIVVPSSSSSSSTSDKKGLTLKWSIPIATEYVSNTVLAVPSCSDPVMNDAAGENPECQYVWSPRRKVATIPYGGGPQDAAISDLRKKLYEEVVKDGLKPVLDASGRPVFFLSLNAVKACYTEEGLGMAVYEWRPQFTNANEVGIELEL
jgi:hypothetical protein